jgi:hypothetical protein
MKKLTKEEVEKAGAVKHGRTTKLRMQLTVLDVGEGLFIEKGVDWFGKMPPYRIVNYYQKQSKRKFSTGRTQDGKGWIVQRLS